MMIKLISLALFISVASADVSRLLNKNQYQPQRYQPNRPSNQYYRPTPAPFVPVSGNPSYVRPDGNYVKNGEAAAAILRLDSDIQPDGSYQYNYETENGISAQQFGTLKQVDKEVAVVVQGSYQYPGPDGPIQITYVADENGYQPSGNILPTPPPIPDAILRSIEYNKAHPNDDQPVKPVYRPY